MTLTIESLRPGDGEARHALLRQAFGATRPYLPDVPELDPDRVVAAYAGDELAGVVVTFGFDQTWGGVGVPCGGVSGVVVAPQHRGAGAARRMLAESFARMRRRGEVVSALYPTTATLYRSVGYEIVAWFTRRDVPLSAVPTGPSEDLRWRRVDFFDDALLPLIQSLAGRHEGWVRLDPVFWAYRSHVWTSEHAENRFAYVGARDGADVACLVYRYASSDAAMYDLDLEVVGAVDSPALSAALGFLAGHGTTAGAIRTTLPADLLTLHLDHVQRTTVRQDWPLMLRIVEPAPAIEARGWPASVEGRVELSLTDSFLPDNEGSYVLEIAAGQARLHTGGSGRVALSAQDLAVLYAGGDVGRLEGAGRLPGATADDLDLLRAAFVANPTCPVFF